MPKTVLDICGGICCWLIPKAAAPTPEQPGLERRRKSVHSAAKMLACCSVAGRLCYALHDVHKRQLHTLRASALGFSRQLSANSQVASTRLPASVLARARDPPQHGSSQWMGDGPDKPPAGLSPSAHPPLGRTAGPSPPAAPRVLSSADQLPPDPFLVAKDDVVAGDGAAADSAGPEEAGGKEGSLPPLPWRENPLFTKARAARASPVGLWGI